MTQRSALTMLIHGHSGVGKSDLADTVPGPRLILDAEAGSEYTPSWPKQVWNPQFAPPGMHGCEPGQEQYAETVRVIVQEWKTWELVHYWIASGNHPFTSIVLDSLTEIQKRCRDSIRGTEQMQTQHWGELLILMETAVRQLRDLAKSPYNRLMNVIILALTDQKERGKALAQGSLADSLPGFVDVVGYMSAQAGADGMAQRWLQVQPLSIFTAKDRTKVITQYLSFPGAFGYILIRDQLNPQPHSWTLAEAVQAIETRYNTGGTPS